MLIMFLIFSNDYKSHVKTITESIKKRAIEKELAEYSKDGSFIWLNEDVKYLFENNEE